VLGPAAFADAATAATPFRALLVSLLQFFATTYRSVFEMEHPPLHDPCAVFFAIAPHAFRTVRCRVDVETASPFSAGQTVADLINVGGHAEEQKNAVVATRMDVPAFWHALLDAVSSADAVSPMNATLSA
jgi:inosine-uridine nucleoside N-ribohydrolase